MVSGSYEDCMLVSIDIMFDMLLKVLILVEDRNFYNYYGVVFLFIFCVLMVNIVVGWIV